MDIGRNNEFTQEIKNRLSENRFYHSVNVAYEAKKLAENFGADPEKAFTAGLLHDIMKDTDKAVQLEIIEKGGIKLSDTEMESPKTWHEISGAVYIRDVLKVTDEEIITAVRYHTTARAGMSLLEKVLYIADFISADRDYDDVDIMREKAYRSLEEAMLYGLQFTIKKMVTQGRTVHEDSVFAYNEVAISEKRKEK